MQLFAGALIVAVLSLFTEVGLGLAQRGLTPDGLRTVRRTRKVTVLPGVATAPAVPEERAAAAG